MRKTFSKKSLLITLYGLYIILVFEGFSRLFFSTDTVTSLLSANNSISWRLSWLKKHKQIEEVYKFDIYEPIRGWALKPNIKNMPVFEFRKKILNSNSVGLRGRREYKLNKPKGKTRIIVLGDSFTFGEGVSDGETYPQQLQNILPNAEVMNYGVHGYGHDQMFLYLKEEGVKYKPDIVIIGFVRYDMNRNIVSFRDYAKPKYEFVNGRLKLTNVPVPKPEAIIKSSFIESKFVLLLKLLYLHSPMFKQNRHMNAITTGILNKIVETAKIISAVPLFIYLPTGDEATRVGKIKFAERYMLDYCIKNNVKYLSLHPVFTKNIKMGVTFSAKHWGEKENKIAAQEIKKYLIKNALLSKNAF